MKFFSDVHISVKIYLYNKYRSAWKYCIIYYIKRRVSHKRPLVKASGRIWNTENPEEWRDFAGSYGIQTAFGKWAVKSIDGEYDTVVGLPLKLLRQKLIELGVDIKKESD